MSAGAITSVVIGGGGIVGWSAAAALRRRLPMLDVTVIATDPPADALAERIGCTLPSIVEFHHDLGLTDEDTVVRARSGLRLGTRFDGWADGHPAYVHAYGEYGQPAAGSAFHHHWLRSAMNGSARPFECYSAAAVIGESGRFLDPDHASAAKLPPFGYGLHIEPGRYREMMRAFALHLGVEERTASIADVRLRAEDGFVANLQLGDGSEIPGDLFIDATGAAARIRGALDDAQEDWGSWFPCDRVLTAEAPPPADPALVDRVIALPTGWRWEAKAPARTSHGLVYSSKHLDDKDAERILIESAELEPTSPAVEIRPRRRSEPWLRNCVAIGDAAVVVEPLEWTNLHLAHSAIDRLVSMLPDRDCNPVELWDYNRQANAEADRVRDFLILHYILADRPADDFWNHASRSALPPSLEHSLTQFRERGRLPFYEEETFARDSWLAVLIGQGVIPRRVDPLLDSVPRAQSEQLMAHLHESFRAVVDRLPTHRDYLRTPSWQVPS